MYHDTLAPFSLKSAKHHSFWICECLLYLMLQVCTWAH